MVITRLEDGFGTRYKKKSQNLYGISAPLLSIIRKTKNVFL